MRSRKNFIRLSGLLLLLATLAGQADSIRRGDDGRIIRSYQAIRAFKALNPCPATGKIQKICPGYVIDHILPLCAYGIDGIENMQWQSREASRKKDKLEIKQCKAVREAASFCK